MRTLRIGIAGASLVIAVSAAAAQDIPAPPQAAGDNCSFLGCLLHGHGDPAPASQKAATVPAATVPDPARAAAGPAKAARPKAKPAEAVTLAADAAEKPRLKALAAVRPRHRLHLVAAHADEADLTLAPTLDPASGVTALHLYSEQLHVVAGPAIRTLADLRDKQVSFGPADGPTVSIARQAFAAAGIAVKEMSLDQANAFDGLATGDIDAVVMLAPQPSPVLAKLRVPGLHLVEWPEGSSMPPGASAQLLPEASYPGLVKNATRVLAVDAVLRLTARGERSAAARGLFASLKQRTAALARYGFDRLGDAEPELRQGRAVAKDQQR